MDTKHSCATAVNAAESERLAVLSSLELLDTPPEREFDIIVACARSALKCKIALVSIVDDHRQWFKAKCGLDASETPREHAFCAHAIRRDGIMVVPDSLKDDRFKTNPLVLGPPHVRFYAGMPLHVGGGEKRPGRFAVGTLCVIDDKPRTLSPEDEAQIRAFASLVESLLDARATAADAVRLAEERRRVLHRLDLTHRQFRQAERMANIGSWRMTFADQKLEWSDQVYAIHGLSISEPPVLEEALNFYPPQAREIMSAALSRTMDTGQPLDIETDFLTATGDFRRVRTMGELEVDDGQSTALIGVFQDVTSHYLLEQALRKTAHIDELTRIANRARFNQFADEAIAAARSKNETLALLLLDLDNFKTVNDRCGHLAGDTLLRDTAGRLRAPYLANYFPARLGGDEFVLLVPSAGVELPSLIARLLADLTQSISSEGGAIPVSATIGASLINGDVSDRSELLHRADVALYEAKRARRGTGKIFGEPGIIHATNSKRGTPLRAVR